MDRKTLNRIVNKLEQRSLLNDQEHEDIVGEARLCYDSLDEMPPAARDACIARDAWQMAENPRKFAKRIDYGPSLKTNTHALYTSALLSLKTGLELDVYAIHKHATVVSKALVKQRIKEVGGAKFKRETHSQILRMIERLSDKDGASDAWFLAGYIQWLASNQLGNMKLIHKHTDVPQYSEDDEVSVIDMSEIDPEFARQLAALSFDGNTTIEIRTSKRKHKK